MNDAASRPSLSIGKLIVVPAVITLAVTILRLVGELENWAPLFFNKHPGGGGALIGISWLPILFGPYFAWKLATVGEGPASTGKALSAIFAGVVAFVAWRFLFLRLPVQAGIPQPDPVTSGRGSLDRLGVHCPPRLARVRQHVIRLRLRGAHSGADRDVPGDERQRRPGLGHSLRRCGSRIPAFHAAGHEVLRTGRGTSDDTLDRLDSGGRRTLRLAGDASAAAPECSGARLDSGSV